MKNNLLKIHAFTFYLVLLSFTATVQCSLYKKLNSVSNRFTKKTTKQYNTNNRLSQKKATESYKDPKHMLDELKKANSLLVSAPFLTGYLAYFSHSTFAATIQSIICATSICCYGKNYLEIKKLQKNIDKNNCHLKN